MSIAIQVQNLSKAYQLGEIGTGTLGDDLSRWIAKLRGKEDPFLKIGEVNDRTVKGKTDIVWSLKDLNFEIQQGDAVGIIGRNGAGKSTLLKLLSRVTSPTNGEINVKGRIASLLEVGTGFHPELSGRDNIYLNGAILGMRKKEIQKRFDEIVSFSGVERYIDTPVKRYSSGMYVRLAFAVAAHLESEILIVDEVLAVGDAEFQKKCLGKMGEISKGEGRTILFVSHNMNAILNFCKRGIFLKNGTLVASGNTTQIISKYLSEDSQNRRFKKIIDKTKKIQLVEAEIIDSSDKNNVIIGLVLFSSEVRKCSVDVRFFDSINNPIGFASIGGIDYVNMIVVQPGENQLKMNANIENFALGNFHVSIDITNPNIEYFDRNEDCLYFEVIKNTNSVNKRYLSQDWNYGSYNIPLKVVE